MSFKDSLKAASAAAKSASQAKQVNTIAPVAKPSVAQSESFACSLQASSTQTKPVIIPITKTTSTQQASETSVEEHISSRIEIQTTTSAKTQNPQQNETETESIYSTPEAKAAEQMGWTNNDTQMALDALQEAMQDSISSISEYSEISTNAKEALGQYLMITGSRYRASICGNIATVTVRGRNGNSDVQIVTPFDVTTLESCMGIVGTSGEGNGIQFVQKDTNGVYGDQCLGMSAIYGSMLKGQSAYFQQQNGEWTLTSDNILHWDNGILRNRTTINSCTDMGQFTKVTFGSRDEARDESALDMREAIISELQAGNPVIVEVGAISGSSLSRHYVTAIGYTTNKTTGKPEDIIVWDPFTGDCRTLNFSYEEEGQPPTEWIENYDGDRVPVTGQDVGKKASSDNPYAFQLYVWKAEQNTSAHAA